MTFTDNIKDLNTDQKIDGNDLKQFFESSQNRKDLWDNGIPSLKDIKNKSEWEEHAHNAFNLLKEPCQTILKDDRYTGKNFSELDKALKANKIGNDSLTDEDVLQVRTGMALVVFYHALQTGQKLYWDSLGSQSATALDQGRKYFCGEIAKTGTETPAKTGTETPAKTGTETPAKTGIETPAKTGTETPAKTGTETPAKTGTETPAKTGTETPAKTGIETPPKTGTETPAKTGEVESTLIPEAPRSKENALDGVPDKIATGMLDVEDAQRRDYLVNQMNTFLQTRVIDKVILDNNKDKENKLLNGFFTSLATLPSSLNTPTTKYDDVKNYYDSILPALTAADRMKKGDKLKIPASIESYDPTTKKITFTEAKKEIGQNPYIEGGRQHEIERLKNIFDNKSFDMTKPDSGKPGLKQQMEYIHGQTEGKIYTLDMKQSEKYDGKNPTLDASTNTYKNLNESFMNTSERVKIISDKLSQEINTFSLLKAQQKALETKSVANPKDIIQKQFDIQEINEKLFDAELKVISLGIQHDLLTSAKVDTGAITTRLEKIKTDLISSRDKLKKWIEKEGKQQLDVVSVAADKTLIQGQLDKMQTYVDQTPLDQGRIDAMTATINNPIYANYEANMKILQTQSTVITQQSQLRDKYQTELKALDPRDPGYENKKGPLEANIITCTTAITAAQGEKDKVIKTYTDYNADITSKSPKQQSDIKTTEQQSARDQQEIRNGLTKDNMPLLAMTQFPSLYAEAKSNKRDTDISSKQSEYQTKITAELKANTAKTTAEKEAISTEKTDLSPKITEINKKIQGKEEEIQKELAKASSTEGYDASVVSIKQTELLGFYKERSDLLIVRDDNYTKSQFNYQREMFNQKVYIDGFVDHTQSNVDKITAQKVQVESERDSKIKRIEGYYNEYIAMNKIGATDDQKELKTYLTAEKTRIQTQACALATELFGGSFTKIDEVKKNAIDKKNDPGTEKSLEGSLLRKRYDISEQLKTETEQLTKRKLTQNYQQSLLNLAEVTGQHNLMEAKLTQYNTESQSMQTIIEGYEKAIKENEKNITTKTIERDKLSLTDDKRTTLQGEINILTATNTELTKQKLELSQRKTKLDQVISTAKPGFEKMKQAKGSAESTKTSSKKSLDDNTTPIYTDEKSTQYKFETPGGERNKDWDEKRAKYDSPLSSNDTESKTSSGNISSDTTSKDTVASPLEKKPEVFDFDTKFNEAVERITILEPITKDKLKSAIKTLSNEAQEGFLNNPLSFRDTVTTGQKIDKKYRGNFGKVIVNEILPKQANKERINNYYHIERFSKEEVDKIHNDEKDKLVFSKTDLDNIATLLGIKESDINILPYADKDFTGKGIQYGKSGNSYWKVIGEFENGETEGKGTCIRSSGKKYTGDFKNGKQEGKGVYTFSNGDEYIGDFKHGDFEGKGVYTRPSGDKYIGDFLNGTFEGQGKLIEANSKTIQVGTYKGGDFVENKLSNASNFYTVEELKLLKPEDLPTVSSGFTGFGKTSDNAYKGSFKDGIYDGPGILYNKNGDIIAEGNWTDGKLNGKNDAQYLFESNQK